MAGFITKPEARAYAPRTESMPDVKLDAYIEDASDWLRSIAPEPDPSEAEYTSRAKRATLRIVEYFAEVGNLKSKGSVGGDTASKTFADAKYIESLIVPVMGDYASGSTSGAATGFVGTFPLTRG